MTKAKIAGGAAVLVLLVLALTLAGGRLLFEQDVDPAAAASAEITHSTAAASEAHQGFLYGRVTTGGGATYEGRLRWGGDEEAFWGDYFNGFKDENPWVADVPPERLKQSRPIKIFGVEIARRERRIPLGRPFMARFGDITRIVPSGREIRVTLKSGTESASTASLPTTSPTACECGTAGTASWTSTNAGSAPSSSSPPARWAPPPTGCTVRCARARVTSPASSSGTGRSASALTSSRAAPPTVSSARGSAPSAPSRPTRPTAPWVTLLDGRELVLSGTREVGRGNRGIYLTDRRYGRVLVSWDAFERVDFSPGGGGPAYDDFPQGRPLTGSVTTRAGHSLRGRLVYDLDESETTETLDAPSRGVDYTIPFGLIASIVLPDREERAARHARVTLHGARSCSSSARVTSARAMPAC